MVKHRAPSHDASPAVGIALPPAGLIAAYAGAAAVMFAMIFSISAAVMAPPRDVRLAHDVLEPAAKSILAKAAPRSIVLAGPVAD